MKGVGVQFSLGFMKSAPAWSVRQQRFVRRAWSRGLARLCRSDGRHRVRLRDEPDGDAPDRGPAGHRAARRPLRRRQGFVSRLARGRATDALSLGHGSAHLRAQSARSPRIVLEDEAPRSRPRIRQHRQQDEQRKERLLDRDGSFNVTRSGLGLLETLAPYHLLLTISWKAFFSIVGADLLRDEPGLRAGVHPPAGPGTPCLVTGATMLGRTDSARRISSASRRSPRSATANRAQTDSPRTWWSRSRRCSA